MICKKLLLLIIHQLVISFIQTMRYVWISIYRLYIAKFINLKYRNWLITITFFYCVIFLQVPVKSWFDDASDCELLELIPLFEKLSKVDSVYSVLCNSNNPLNNHNQQQQQQQPQQQQQHSTQNQQQTTPQHQQVSKLNLKRQWMVEGSIFCINI